MLGANTLWDTLQMQVCDAYLKNLIWTPEQVVSLFNFTELK